MVQAEIDVSGVETIQVVGFGTMPADQGAVIFGGLVQSMDATAGIIQDAVLADPDETVRVATPGPPFAVEVP
jgi:hypothetical protein